LDSWPKDTFSSYVPQIPVLSSNTGSAIDAEAIYVLLRASVEEILLRQLCWDKVTESCVSRLKDTASSACTLVPISSSAIQSLHTTLKKAGVTNIDVDSALGDISNEPNG